MRNGVALHKFISRKDKRFSEVMKPYVILPALVDTSETSFLSRAEAWNSPSDFYKCIFSHEKLRVDTSKGEGEVSTRRCHSTRSGYLRNEQRPSSHTRRLPLRAL